MVGFWILVAGFAGLLVWALVDMLRGLWSAIKAASPHPPRKDIDGE